MRQIIILFLFFHSILNAQYLLPQPQEYNLLQGKFKITEEIKVRIPNSSEDLYQYTSRFIERMQYKSGIIFKTHEPQDTSTSKEIVIITNKFSENLDLETNESYSINISSSSIKITSENNVGAYRAMETLLQLINTDKGEAFFINCNIIDKPRFKWRGLLVDVCRHWIPLDIIKRNIDAMASVKMNVLHLHLTDDQGFRIESKKFPKLHEMGSDGKYYTQNEIKDIIKYANERGVRVVPEFDIPGHISSWLVGYPKLASIDQNYELPKGYGVFKATLNPSQDFTYRFLDTLLTEMCLLFPDKYFHIGGDEILVNDWNKNKKIQRYKDKYMLTSNKDLHAHFNKKILSILSRNKKIMMGWDDIYNPKLPNSITVQFWRSKESLFNAAKNGYNSILSNGYYLDKVNRIENYYKNTPLPKGNSLTEQEQKMILGGEATMWTEIVNYRTIESRIWPSALAIAERLWSNDKECNIDTLYKKIPIISSQLEEFGLMHLNCQGVMLRMLSRNSVIDSWKPFISVLEPISGYERHQFLKKQNRYTTASPLNRIADACYVESFTARKFNQMVKKNCFSEGYCKQKQEIKYWLSLWTKSADHFTKIPSKSLALEEVSPLALIVQELCELTWRKVNSPNELSENENKRAHKLISDIVSYDLDVRFAPIDGIKIIFNFKAS